MKRNLLIGATFTVALIGLGVTEQALEQKAQELQPAARTGAWMTFGALLLSLLAAIMGAMLGRREPDTLRTRYGDRRTASSAHYNGLERRAAA